ncbi:Mediator complex subunit Med27 [Macrophomina phaseolina MS6]|uniref:Mediator complex subunit Med27 n=1 Tax=Macrophomina phaseolina (strain MS6) TaxID=1126212 RepID=K2S592_MACPH|nr:Mediator complex subunit Med27 [Macrophomina phaseolina MS6]
MERVQNQIDELRHIVTNLTAPFLATQTSPEILSRDFKQTAITEAKRLQTFERTWKSQEVQDILTHATQSFKANPDLTKAAGISRYGWVEVAEKQQRPVKSKERMLRGKANDAEDKTDAASILPTVTAFKDTHPNFKIDIKDGRIITVAFKVPSLVLTFVITCSIDSQNKATFTVECTGNMPLFSAISRCLASRPRPNDLAYLLDMIAAYTNTRTAKCVKCGKLLDNSALSPAARRSKQTTNGDGSTLTTWEPLHEGCL